MKTLVLSLLFTLLLASCAPGQTVPPAAAALPTYVGLGAAFNQIGDPRANIWATAIYPVVSSIGMFTSTTTDIVPRLTVDPVSKRSYYAFTTSIRQGIHKQLFNSGKLSVLLGGDAGIGMNQASPSGLNVGFAGSFTTTAIYQIKPKWALVIPVRGLWINSGWNLIPEVGLLYSIK